MLVWIGGTAVGVEGGIGASDGTAVMGFGTMAGLCAGDCGGIGVFVTGAVIENILRFELLNEPFD